MLSSSMCSSISFLKNYFMYLFINLGCAGSLLLHADFSLVTVRGATLVLVHRLLLAVGSLVGGEQLSSSGLVIAAHTLSCPASCGIFPEQGSNLCPLHWRVDS